MKKVKKFLKVYKKYGVKGAIAALSKKGQVKDSDYEKWYLAHRASAEQLRKQRERVFSYNPLFSIVVPVYNTPEKFLTDMIDSVQNQSYENWELCIANANPSNQQVSGLLNRMMQKDHRIKVTDTPENLGIAQNTNAAVEIAEGEYICLLDHDDVLAPDALYEAAEVLNQEKRPDVIYTDEDKITIDGKTHFQPNFKPEFNLDMLRSNNYICHFFIVKKSLMDQVGRLDEAYNGAQDHDLIFRCTEQAECIVRIPKILYHWRVHKNSTSANPESKRYAYESGIRAIEAHLRRCSESGRAEMTDEPGFFRVRYEVKDKPFVSVIVIRSEKSRLNDILLFKMTADYGRENTEILIIDMEKQNTDNEKNSDFCHHIPWKQGENVSEVLNDAVKKSKGEYILFLSSDIVKISEYYIEEMVSNLNRNSVGVVGGKLYYANGLIKNAGLIIHSDGLVENMFENLPGICRGYMNRQSIQQDLSAVVMDDVMIKRKVWEKAGGFITETEEYTIEFCRKVREYGYLVVYDPYAVAVSTAKNQKNKYRLKKGTFSDFAYNPNLDINYSLKNKE